MEKKGVLTKIYAVIGTVLVWFPILITVLYAVIRSFRRGVLHFEYLLPAELFQIALAGGIVLVWAAIRAHSQRRLIVLSFCITVGLLVGGQELAVAAGLASGKTEPVGWPWVLVIASLAGYALALIGMDVGGVLLLRDLFQLRKHRNTPA